MQAQSGRRYLNSVSDLYGADEIEVLWDEIRTLEPSSCRPEDIQDFEIAGSQTGVASVADCESPAVTVRSWDSHANYRVPGSYPGSIFHGVILYCDETHLKSSTGVVRVLLVISSVACLACLCSSGTVKLGLFMLPLVARLRLMMFVTIFSLLVTVLLLFLDISHIIYLFPFNWGKLNAWFYVSVSVLYLISSSLILHLLNEYQESYSWIPKKTRDHLLATGVLGYICAIEALVLSVTTSCCRRDQYRPVVTEDSSEMKIRDSALQPLRSDSPTHRVTPPNKLAVPSSASTSSRVSRMRNSASAPLWPLDDGQPGSSKHNDGYAWHWCPSLFLVRCSAFPNTWGF